MSANIPRNSLLRANRVRGTGPKHTYKERTQTVRSTFVTTYAMNLETSTRACDWVRRRFGPALARAVEASGPDVHCVELVEPNRHAPGARPANAATDRLKPAYSFTEFVIGVSNRFAHAAALAVSE